MQHRLHDLGDGLRHAGEREQRRLAAVLALALLPQRLPVAHLVLIREEVGPILCLLVNTNQTSVVVFKARITGPEKLDPDVDTSQVKNLCFAVRAGIDTRARQCDQTNLNSGVTILGDF